MVGFLLSVVVVMGGGDVVVDGVVVGVCGVGVAVRVVCALVVCVVGGRLHA